MVAFQKKVKLEMLDNSCGIGTVRSKIKKIETPMTNTLQLAARKNLIQMLSDVINYNSNCHSGLSRHLKHEAKRVALCSEAEGSHFEHLL
jgi:cbb3-type cytochrome oxidase cytochrome c subunit